jgi:hypothetical protein
MQDTFTIISLDIEEIDEVINDSANLRSVILRRFRQWRSQLKEQQVEF